MSVSKNKDVCTLKATFHSYNFSYNMIFKYEEAIVTIHLTRIRKATYSNTGRKRPTIFVVSFSHYKLMTKFNNMN
jgi:hypothetical protein